MRSLKDSASPYREVQLARVAAVEAILAGRDSFLRLAFRADHAIRPEAGFKVPSGRLLIGEQLKEFEGADS